MLTMKQARRIHRAQQTKVITIENDFNQEKVRVSREPFRAWFRQWAKVELPLAPISPKLARIVYHMGNVP